MQTAVGATELMYACQQCMENEVLELIRKQPNSVKDRDRTSKTPLHYCAENPNTSCAEVVLRAAPELVNAQDDNGYCTLHLAVIAGNKALIKLLIMKGADVNIQDNEGHSAVHWAIVSSEKEALEMIIRAGANPSTADIHGGYPLHYAVQMCGSSCDYVKSLEDAIRVVETLLNFGVDVNVKDKDSRQPILWAASAGSPEAVIHLVSSGACVEAADKDGLTALHCAASRGHTTTLETLISLCGANVDVIDGNGCSALFYAVTLGHADATELLLQLGAEPNRQDRKGRTPAHCGAAKGQIETLRILQKHGGNLWVRNVKGDIPLHEAVASGRKDLVLWLLSQNSEAINIANNDGRCPLHIASMYNNTEMVKVLLDSKSLVNPIMRTSKGVLMTPLNVALSKGHRSCGKYLQLHGGVPFSKVARLEPASGFSVRLSPSDETMIKSDETGKETMTASQGKISKSRSFVEIHGSQESDKAETTEKKKVYRRRKKKKSVSSVPTQDSDSEESVQDVRLKVVGSRKVKKSNGAAVSVKDNSDENVQVEKVRTGFKTEKNSKNASTTNSQIEPSREAVETSEGKKTVKRKTLQTNKSFNETKNVSDLSPEDFPPLMQTINQLDMVMMEPDIEENKVEGDSRSSKAEESAAVGPELVRAAKETEVVGEKREELPVAAETVLNSRSDDNHEMRIEVKEDKIEKTAVSSKEESVKAADDKETKSAEIKTGGSTSEEGPHRKPVKSPKTSNGSGKREERLSKSEKSNSSGSGGSDKQKKAGRPKSPKITTTTAQTSEKSTDATVIKKKDDEDKNILSSERKTDEEKRGKNENANADKERRQKNENTETEEKIRENENAETEEKIRENENAKTEEKNRENENPKTDEKNRENENPKTDEKNGEKNESAETDEKNRENENAKTEEKNRENENAKTEEKNRENENARTTAESETNEGVTPQEQTQSTQVKDLPQVENVRTDFQTETENRENEFKSSRAIENVKDLNQNDSALPPEPQPPQEKPPSVPGVTPTKAGEMDPSKGNAIGSGIQTSPQASEQASDGQRLPETEQISSDMFLSGTLPAHNASAKPSPNEAELVVEMPGNKAKGGERQNGSQQEVIDAEIPDEKPEVNRVSPAEPTEDVKAEDDAPKEKVGEASKTQNVGNGEQGEGSETRDERNEMQGDNSKDEEFPDGGSSRKNDGSDEHKPPKVTRVSRLCRRQREFKSTMNEMSVTQLVQNTLRKYHMERGIFYQLLELKRYQIRSGRANEQVLVKRLADEYERSRVFLGMKPFSGLYKFREFEKFLYDQLKALNARRSFLIPEMKSYDDIDAMSGFLKKSRYKIINDVAQPETVCTCITQRCHHSACAYTSVPCSGYITDLRRFRCHKTRKEGFFPRIEQPSSLRSDTDKIPGRPTTLELIQGNEKHVITLPQNSPGKGKRYYVTFTIKSAPVFKEEDLAGDAKNSMKHRHAKSV